jgi:hypothetical protein
MEKAHASRRRLREHDGLVSDGEDAALGPQLYRSGQHDALHVLPKPGQRLSGMSVADAYHFLFDDWPFVEVTGDEVGSRTNEFHTARIGLVIRPSPLETREKRMMNVDRSATKPFAQIVGKNLHIPS